MRDSLKFIITYQPDLGRGREFIKTLDADFVSLVGHSNIIFACRKNRNTASILFGKYGFAQKEARLSNQKCRNCKPCISMSETIDDIELYTGEKLNVSKTATCQTEDVTYVYICSGCKDFYFGQTMSQFNVRMNGHRGKFDVHDDKYKKSALSFHMYEDHFDEFGCKTKFFNCAILDHVDPNRLNRRESYYIWKTQADIRHLNRMQVVRK